MQYLFTLRVPVRYLNNTHSHRELKVNTTTLRISIIYTITSHHELKLYIIKSRIKINIYTVTLGELNYTTQNRIKN